MTFDADYLVVGSGFGGSVSALRLAEKGYSVVMLERGRRYQPEDFPTTNWALRRYLWWPRFGLHGIQVLTFLRHALVLHGCGVGGGSLVYANTLIEPGQDVFRRPGWGERDWPSLLGPHYAEARRMLGAARCKGVGRTDRLLEEVIRDMGSGERLEGHDVGVFFGDPGVRVPDPYFDGAGPERVGCTLCGACMVGCRVGAKNTLDKNYLWLAEQLGVRIVPETEATHVRPVTGGYVVEARRSLGVRRPRSSWRSRRVVIAGGVIGTVRLLMASKRGGWLPDLSDRLGCGVGTNSESLLAADTRAANAALDDHVAITSGVRADADTYIEMVRFNRGSDALFWLAMPLGRGSGPWAMVKSLLARPLQALRGLWPLGRARRTGIVLAMQATAGSLTLSARPPGLFGRGVRLASSVEDGKEAPVSDIPVATEVTRRLARKMGGDAWSTLPVALLGAPTTAHILGGCPMGETGEAGVVDFDGRVHGYPGLHVVDGSVVPGNLGVNPSLTITAMAEYFMSRVPESSLERSSS